MRFTFIIPLFLLSTLLYAQKSTSPIGFIENKGQIVDQKGKENKQVHYLLNTPGLNVQLKNHGFSYDVYETKKVPLSKKDKSLTALPTPFTKEQTTPDYTLEYTYHRIDIDFENSNPGVQLVAEGKSADYDNYYNVVHAPEGITAVHKYQKVTYQNIYNQIDVVFFIPKDSTKSVEYNFIVKPGGKVSDIQMKFNGVKTELADNKIKMNVRFGQMEETLPLSWIEQGSSKKEIAVNYVNIKKNVYGFAGDVNTSDKTIVIDPVPVRLWGTYYGGDGRDLIYESTIDLVGNTYFVGETYSTNNIATNLAHQHTFWPLTNPNVYITDCFIVKFDPNGNRLFGTYLGGNQQDNIGNVTIDRDNNLIITGTSNSNENAITSPNSYQQNLNFNFNGSANNFDAYLVKFAPNGTRIWGTFFGGNLNESSLSVACDNLNNIYITGITFSLAGIATPGAHKPAFDNQQNSQYDGYIVKFSTDGNRIWGTYFGGEIQEVISDIAVDSNNNLYIVGSTFSTTGISTPNAPQTSISSINNSDGFISKFTSNGAIIWSSYVGGNLGDSLYGIKISDTNLYVIGGTASTNNIATPGSYLTIPPNIGYGDNGLIIKFNFNGQKIWGTYLYEESRDLDIDSFENIYLAGYTQLHSNIATTDPYDNVVSFGEGYIQKFNKEGNIVWGTYYGGESMEDISTITHYNNHLYIGGTTISRNDIASAGSHQPNYSDSFQDGFIAKFQDCLLNPQASSNSPICVGQNLQLNASGGATYSWTGPNGFTSTDQNPVIATANASHSGQYFCTITGTGGCDGTITVNVVVGDTTAPVANITNLPTITGDCHTVVTIIPSATDNCAGAINGTTTDPLTYTIPGNYTIVWSYTDGNGNTSTQNQSVVITATTLPVATSQQQFCIQDNATLNTITINGQNIQWYDASTGGNLLASSTLLQNGITYYASQTINGCESARIPVTITIQNTQAPTGNTSQSFCSSANATLNNISIAGTNVLWYSSSVSTQPLAITTLLVDNTTYYATQTINGCESPTRLGVSIDLINTLNAQNYQVEFCDDQNNDSEIIDLASYNQNLIASATGNTFSYYKSLSGAQNQSASERISNFSSYPLQTGTITIYVRIDNMNTCHQIVTLQLALFGNPTIPIQDIMPICEGSSITVDAGSGNDSYSWSTGASSQQITVSTPGNYSVSVTQNHSSVNCSTTKSFTVVNSNIATIENIVLSEWTTANNTITVLLTSNSQGDYVYSLDGVNYQSGNTFENLPSGQYTVYVKDKNGCGITDKDVLLLMYPKFFTPNGDGYNDYWQIDNSTAKANFKILIFDRLGKLLKAIDSHSGGWDGTFNGQPLPSTDYWFTFTMSDGKEYKGHFALKR